MSEAIDRIMPKMRRKSKLPDETDSAFEKECFQENPRIPFGICNQKKNKLFKLFEQELDRRFENEDKRQARLDIMAHRKPAPAFRIGKIREMRQSSVEPKLQTYTKKEEIVEKQNNFIETDGESNAGEYSCGNGQGPKRMSRNRFERVKSLGHLHDFQKMTNPENPYGGRITNTSNREGSSCDERNVFFQQPTSVSKKDLLKYKENAGLGKCSSTRNLYKRYSLTHARNENLEKGPKLSKCLYTQSQASLIPSVKQTGYNYPVRIDPDEKEEIIEDFKRDSQI